MNEVCDCESNGQLGRAVGGLEPTPTCESKNRVKQIRIEQLDYGYSVRVGCQSFAIETVEKLMTALDKYLANPDTVERAWYDGKFLK